MRAPQRPRSGGIITDPGNRDGLRHGTLADWLATLACVPALLIAMLAVIALAARSRARTPGPPR